ncbi:MAG: ImmA/IrrE family metallo-endopeptidase [Deltaproteobacteria bacterium]|nr:ImmA/IrrE family metallo-endopeptidase [Deltaproteobacteria bacterium]
MAEGRYGWIRAEARKALTLSGATGPHEIDAIRIAKALDVDIVDGGLVGATERITMIGGRARIRVCDQIVLKGRRCFTIAHAIGHKACGHLIEADGDVNRWIDAACSGRTKQDEREADVFSTEVLAPAAWVRPYCDVRRVDLDAVHTIVRDFPVSPVMAAMRFVELSTQACAVVYSEQGSVRWARGSRSFPRLVAREMCIPATSIAREWFGTSVIDTHVRAGLARSWFPDCARVEDRAEIFEHAMLIPEPGWGGVLSLLWIPQIAPRAERIRAAKKIASPI